MVERSYMTEQPAGPSALKARFDQEFIPFLIDAVAPVEALLYRASGRARRQPLAAIGAALACGYLLRALLARGGVRR